MSFIALCVAGLLIIMTSFLLVFSLDKKYPPKTRKKMLFTGITLQILIFVIIFILLANPAFFIK